MNKRDHVVNAVLLSVGIAFLLEPASDVELVRTVCAIGVPVVLGALVPDIDTAFGRHRKTLHNVWVLGVFVAFPVYFDNLHFVWLGVLTHYVLDLLGNVRGMAVVYPYPREFDVPVGVPVDSHWAFVVTIAVTVLELAAVAAVIALDLSVVDFGALAVRP